MSKNKGYKKIGTKNGKNIYEAIIEVGFDINGKRKRKRKRHTGNNQSAEIWYAELVKEYYHKAKEINVNDTTFEEYSILFIKNYCEPNISKITLKDYKALLKDILPIIGDIKLNEIDTFMLDTMYQKIKIGKKGKELSPKTMIHYFDLVNLMLKQAKRWKLIENNPNEDAIRPKNVKKKRNYYNKEQVETLFHCLEQESIKYRTIIVLTLISGVRRSELCAIRWNDIDFDNKTIYIDNSLKVIDGIVDEEKAKTEYSIRSIDMDDVSMDLLREYKEWQDRYIASLGDKWQGTNRVFTSKNGGHIHPDTCNKILQKVLKKYELPKITFHELRHTCATLLNSEGVDPITIKERLGHSNVNITLDIYTHSLESSKKASVNIFNDLHKNKKSAI